MIRALFFALTLTVSPLAVTSAHAEEPEIYTSWRNNLAVQGYDVMSFYAGTPQLGKAEFKTEYAGAEWQFVNQGNLDLFQMNPEMFIPEYGGYCAWAVAKGKLAKGSPDYYYVEDGKLYLNFNGRIKRRWDKNRDGFVALADAKWPAILAD
ncbi:YHS domain-containing (seleno)protein [Litorimonas sp. RW-G-Af-16]|uniref:YHS domain-containing (seleno)protein n=1 Tax=Litorimonas sp. RW-G-Af-16 TaxID=3241168 RepID=UPI00390C7ADC